MVNKKSKRKKKTDDELKNGAKWVNYEFDMLIRTFRYRADKRDCSMNNMIIESFLVHTRNLYEFFRKRNRRDKDEVLSLDYVVDNMKNKSWNNEQGKLKDNLKSEVKRIHQRLAHISYDRNLPEREWDRPFLFKKLNYMMQKFKEHIPENSKDWFWVDPLPSSDIELAQTTDSTSLIQAVAHSGISSHISHSINPKGFTKK